MQEDPEIQKSALIKILGDEDLLKKLYSKVALALDKVCKEEQPCSFIEGLDKENRRRLLNASKERFAMSPILIHKLAPYRVFRFLGEKTNLENEFGAYALSYLTNPNAHQRDLFREVIQRAPSDVFKNQAETLYKLYSKTSDDQLKKDLSDGFLDTLGVYKDIVFHKDWVNEFQFSKDGKRM